MQGNDAAAATPSPFDLKNTDAYRRWREQKLEQAPRSIDDLIVEVRNLRSLSPAEHDALLQRCRRANMAIYASRAHETDQEVVHLIGRQFGLTNPDANWLAGEDAVSRIAVSSADIRHGYIPYTNLPIKWHTDGYYNPPERSIRGMILHCAQGALTGGENRLMDHEMAYLLLRDANPDFVCALSATDAMTIPERTDEEGVARAAQSGPVFSVDDNGALHMRYTARTRSIEWKQDTVTLAAVAFLQQVLSSSSPYIYCARLEPGMGLLCNNVLHDRAGFSDDVARPRVLYRARYYQRIAGT